MKKLIATFAVLFCVASFAMAESGTGTGTDTGTKTEKEQPVRDSDGRSNCVEDGKGGCSSGGNREHNVKD